MMDTKEKILDAAERVFSEHGYSAASLRSIIAEAGVNLAAVHYHFGSKDELLRAVVRRRVEPVNRQRLRLLDEYERAAGAGPLPVEQVLTAFLEPALRLVRAHPGGATFVRLMGRLYVDDALGEIMRRDFGELVARFGAAFRRALPELPERDLRWRLHLGIGAVAQALRGPQAAPGVAAELKDAGEEELLDGLVAFLGAAFRAPARQAAGREA